jgi:hypothetical protein
VESFVDVVDVQRQSAGLRDDFSSAPDGMPGETTSDVGVPQSGVLVVPAPLSREEWDALYAPKAGATGTNGSNNGGGVVDPLDPLAGIGGSEESEK